MSDRPSSRDGRAAGPGLDRLTAAALFALTAFWLLSFRPFEQAVSRDAATWMYLSVEVADGLAPHRDVFIHKTPGAALLGGAGAWTATRLGLGDALAGARIVFLLLGSAAPALLFLICRSSMGRVAALACAVFFLAVDQWPAAVLDGVRPKVATVTLGLGAIVAALARRPRAAGALSAACALCWQPGLCFGVAAAWELGRYGGGARAIARMTAGAALVGLPFLAYLGAIGAIGDFWEQAVLFNFGYIETKAMTPAETVARIASIVEDWTPFEAVLLLPALVGLGIGGARPPRSLAISGIGYGLLLFVNLQAWPDTILLAPLLAAALGAGLCGLVTARNSSAVAPGVVLAAALWLALHPAPSHVRTKVTLEQQRRYYRELAGDLRSDDPVIALSLPEFLIHNGRRSAWKWPFLWNGVDRFAAERTGGFDGLIEDLDRIDPAMVVVCRRWTAEYRDQLERWAALRYTRERHRYYPYVRPIIVFRRKDRRATEAAGRAAEHRDGAALRKPGTRSRP